MKYAPDVLIYSITMGNVFVPYFGDKPASIDINGHKLIILATEAGALEDDLDLIGGDHVKRYSTFKTEAELQTTSVELAKSCDAGVVIAPVGVEVSELVRNLENELPWLQ